MKCPYCHIEFFSQAGYYAHVESCAYKNNPLPEPEPAEDMIDEFETSPGWYEIPGIEKKLRKDEALEALRG